MMRRTVHLAVAFALVSEAVGFGLNLPMGLSARSAVKHGALGATAADRDSSALNRRALFQVSLLFLFVGLMPCQFCADALNFNRMTSMYRDCLSRVEFSSSNPAMLPRIFPRAGLYRSGSTPQRPTCSRCDVRR